MTSPQNLPQVALEKALYATGAVSWAVYVEAENFRQTFEESVEQAKDRANSAIRAEEEALAKCGIKVAWS